MLDIEQPGALINYLQQTGRLAADERPQVQPLGGGVSNRTVLVERSDGTRWVIKQALEKLRVPVDWFSSPERVHRESEGLRWFAELAPPGAAPAFIFEDHEFHLLGMSAVAEPQRNWKLMLLEGQVELDHIRQFATLLATVQGNALRQRPEVAAAFADRSFFESLRLEPYYGYTAEQIPEATRFLAHLIQATRSRQITLVHGDYSPKNVLFHQNQLILLDYEVIHFGDPAFDLGFSMTHFLSKAHHLPAYRLAFEQAAQRYWETYLAAVADLDLGPDLENWAVQHTLGCLLARVAGRSPLEYLSAAARQKQRAVVLSLMADIPEAMPTLIHKFITGVS